MPINIWRPKRLILLAATILALSPSVAFAGDAVTIQGNIAHYEGTPLNTVHITSVIGGVSGHGAGWDCQSWWRFNGGTYFYSYNMRWSYSFTFSNNGNNVALYGTTTSGVAC